MFASSTLAQLGLQICVPDCFFQLTELKAIDVACALVAWSHGMVYAQCHRSKRTAQLGSSRILLQVRISEVEFVATAVTYSFQPV